MAACVRDEAGQSGGCVSACVFMLMCVCVCVSACGSSTAGYACIWKQWPGLGGGVKGMDSDLEVIHQLDGWRFSSWGSGSEKIGLLLFVS